MKNLSRQMTQPTGLNQPLSPATPVLAQWKHEQNVGAEVKAIYGPMA